jgi:lactate dehydrogenase-like 2-hydroxyacid dehydrogenase
MALAEWSDAFFVSTVGGPETQGLVSGDVIEALGSEAVLINIARGSVIEEQALLEALETRRLAGAGLDVFASEPDLNRKFATLENTILTPHIGSATIPARQAMGQLMMDNVLAHFAGRPLLTPVN